MAYPQELINEVLDYLDSGHFRPRGRATLRRRPREALPDGGASATATLRANRPHPVKYPRIR
ncbi:MAG: hypothetical protein ACLTSX_00615 [Collinsella sp.]